MAFGKYGQDRAPKSSESFISGALTGGSGKSNEIFDRKIDRPNQTIKTAFAMDNVKLAMDTDSAIQHEEQFGGGINNLKHSLTGSSAVNEEVGAAGSVKHVIIPNH